MNLAKLSPKAAIVAFWVSQGLADEEISQRSGLTRPAVSDWVRVLRNGLGMNTAPRIKLVLVLQRAILGIQRQVKVGAELEARQVIPLGLLLNTDDLELVTLERVNKHLADVWREAYRQGCEGRKYQKRLSAVIAGS